RRRPLPPPPSETFFRRDFSTNPKKTPRISIYKIHHPPSSCTAVGSRPPPSPPPWLPPHDSHLRPPPSPSSSHRRRCAASHHTPIANATATITAATATAFPSAVAAVVGLWWQIGHHRRGGAYETPDFLGCPPPNHDRGGGRTTVQLPQPHLVVSAVMAQPLVKHQGVQPPKTTTVVAAEPTSTTTAAPWWCRACGGDSSIVKLLL
nr:hypothetical protein [Tanacetum cinerariifolium]